MDYCLLFHILFASIAAPGLVYYSNAVLEGQSPSVKDVKGPASQKPPRTTTKDGQTRRGTGRALAMQRRHILSMARSVAYFPLFVKFFRQRKNPKKPQKMGFFERKLSEALQHKPRNAR